MKTNGEDTLMTPMTEDTLIIPVMTSNYYVTTPVTDNPCDDIDDLEQIAVKYVEQLMVGDQTKWQNGWQGDYKDELWL